MFMFKGNALIVLVLILTAVLRFWRLDVVPVSLFGDEVDMGYQAYSLLNTGKDYFGNFLPSHLKSLADIKPAFYAYSLIPSIAVFGISPWGVRIPAAFFGVLDVLLLYLVVSLLTKNKNLALLSAIVLGISPWHIQYSRAGFEHTELVAFYLAGLYLFFKSFQRSILLLPSLFFFGLTLWVYQSAKVFLPLSLVGLALIYRDEIRNISPKYLAAGLVLFLLVVIPIIQASIFDSGANRFGSTTVFSDQVMEGEIGADRLTDNRMGSLGEEKLFHNKPLWGFDKITENYLKSFSTDFLFVKGDSNLRHNIGNFGGFFRFEALFLILGLVFLFSKFEGRKVKALLLYLLIISPLPGAITQNGGVHAGRLFFLLLPLSVLIAMGIYYLYQEIRFRKTYILIVGTLFLLGLLIHQHNYWTHYPEKSIRFWHAGYEEAIKTVVSESEKYDKVIISNADEPSLIFFLGWSMFPPEKFQKDYPLKRIDMPQFGQVSILDKYYFPRQGFGVNLYDLGKVLPEKTLYMATIKEVNLDLIAEPSRIPADIKLVKAFVYPSGRPAFYLFTRK